MSKKIAILGGGAGSLFAAWKLVSSDPSAYDITVYQMGWRLGGKGASGRRVDDAYADRRVEEHGLHFMFGFYENVFSMVREVYKETYGNDELWKSFFRTEDTGVTMIHYHPDGTTWDGWRLPYPESATSEPGLVTAQTPREEYFLALRNMLEWFKELLHPQTTRLGALHDLAELVETPANRVLAALDLPAIRAAIDAHRFDGPVGKLLGLVDGIAQRVSDTLTHLVDPVWVLADKFLERLTEEHSDREHKTTPEDANRWRWITDHLMKLLRLRLGEQENFAKIECYANLIKTFLVGIFVDIVLQKNATWWSLDAYDLREWLRRHGGDATSPPVDGLYDAVFGSDVELSAGAITQAFVRAAFLFKGGFIYKMQAGMGDTIFTPLYKALKKKGVKFRFFHRVRSVESDPNDPTLVKKIRLERQLPLPDDVEYDPLIAVPTPVGDLGSLDCWPSAPRWDELARLGVPAETIATAKTRNFEDGWRPIEGDVRTLEYGNDFGDVILGISVAALKDICPDLLARDPRFDEHVDKVGKFTVATQAMQVWTVDPQKMLSPSPVVVPNKEPLDTISDMTHLIKSEQWGNSPPGRLFYLCSRIDWPIAPPSDTTNAARLLEVAKKNGRYWLDELAPVLWKDLRQDGGNLRWDGIFSPKAARDPDSVFAEQYVNTPANLSDRYVMAAPGTYAKRLRSNETCFTNLYLAGDWIKTALSIGCLEATAMSGIQAARALAMENGFAEIAPAVGDWIGDGAKRPKPALPGAGPVMAPRSALLYRRRDGEMHIQPPYTIAFDDVFVFVVRADRDKLRAICDAQLNLDPTRRVSFGPLGDFVVFYAANITNTMMGTSLATKEVGVWIPVASADAVLTYSPYVYIDSTTSAITGREVFGYTKLPGDVSVPGEGDPLVIRASGDALVITNGHSAIRREPLVTIASSAGGDFRRTDDGLFASIEDGAAVCFEMLRNVVDPPSPRACLAILQGAQSVFLKQLPGAGPEASAAYQAVVQAAIVPDARTFRTQALPGEWTITLPSYTEPSIAATLGLDSEAERVRVLAQMRLSFQGTLAQGTELWVGNPRE